MILSSCNVVNVLLCAPQQLVFSVVLWVVFSVLLAPNSLTWVFASTESARWKSGERNKPVVFVWTMLGCIFSLCTTLTLQWKEQVTFLRAVCRTRVAARWPRLSLTTLVSG